MLCIDLVFNQTQFSLICISVHSAIVMSLQNMFIHPRSWFVFSFDKTGNGVVLNTHVYESHIHNATLW